MRHTLAFLNVHRAGSHEARKHKGQKAKIHFENMYD
jgi:hypothetical protein